MTRIQSVDGLRCLAVLAVLIFHVNPDWLPGGYLGVDLFFVISGFVVTMSLANRQMPYFGFLARRFYRLAPAAGVTIIATLLTFHFTGLGLLEPAHAYSGLAAIFAVSNIYFMTHASYFDTALHGNPFLHFWSLSVEEQFYLVWPAVFLLLARRGVTTVVVVLVAFAAASLALSIYYPQQAFYLMPARAYQFAAGALGYFALHRRHFTVSPVVLYGLVAAAILLFMINDGTEDWWRGGLVPTIVFALLVAAATKVSADPLFRAWPIQIIARASYSIYLVHWPIVVYISIIIGPGPAAFSLMLLFSLSIGILLFYGIEGPFNHYKSKGRSFTIIVAPTQIAGPAVSVLAVTVVAAILINGRPSPTANATPAATQASAPAPMAISSDAQRLVNQTQSIRKEVWKKLWSCNTFEVGRRRGEKKYKLLSDLDLDYCLTGRYAVFVDSTGVVAIPPITMQTNSREFAILGSAGCQFILSASSADCMKMNEVRADVTAARKCNYETVYIAMNWSRYSDAAFDALLDHLKKSACNIVLLHQLPHLVANPSQLIAAAGGGNPDLSGSVDQAAAKRHRQLLELASSNIEILDVSPLGGPLPALTPSGKPIYMDKYHYTQEGISWLMRIQAEKLVRRE